MSPETQTAARAFVRSLNILLKFARLYEFGHAKTTAQFDTTWKELRQALEDSGGSGVLLGASGHQILLDGVPMGSSAGERSFAHLLTSNGIASIHFSTAVAQAQFARFVRAFPSGNAKPSALAEQLKAALGGDTSIKVNEIRYVAEDSSVAGIKVAAQLTAKALGAQGEKFREFFEDPNKMLQMILAAESSRGGGGGIGGPGHGPGGGGGLVGVRGRHGTRRPGRCGSGWRSRNRGRPGRRWLGNREWRRQWRGRRREWWSRWRTWWDRYWPGRGCRRWGGRNGRSLKMANRLRPAAWRKGWRRARLAGNGRRRVPSRGGRRPRDAGIVRSIGEGAEGSGLVADGCADFPIAIERDARARAVHAAASAGGVSGAGSGRQTGQAHAAEAGRARGHPLCPRQLRAGRAARECSEATAGPHEHGNGGAAQDSFNPGTNDGAGRAFRPVVYGAAGPGILGAGAGRKQKGSIDFGRGMVRAAAERARVPGRDAATR